MDGVDGLVSANGRGVDKKLGVRPALKLNLSSVIFSSNTFKVVATPVSSVTLDKTETQTINIGGIVKFTAIVSPDGATDKKVKWSTSSSKVRLYSDESCTILVGGDATDTLTVYAKGFTAGEDSITVTSNSDSTKTASCNINVKRFEPTVGISPYWAGTVRLKYEDEDYINGTLFLDPIANAGYEFDHWSYNSGDTSNSSSLKYTNQTNIVAHFEPASYTVTFRDYDGTVLKKFENVAYNSSVTPPDNPTRTGYTFNGWDRGFTNITSNLTVTATYTVNTYTVTWVNYDDTVLKEESVGYGVTPTYTG